MADNHPTSSLVSAIIFLQNTIYSLFYTNPEKKVFILTATEMLNKLIKMEIICLQ